MQVFFVIPVFIYIGVICMKKSIIVLVIAVLSVSSVFAMGQTDQVKSTTVSGGYESVTLNVKEVGKITTSGFGVKLDSFSSRPEKHNWNGGFSIGAYFPNSVKDSNKSVELDVTDFYEKKFVLSFVGGATYSFLRNENCDLSIGPVIGYQMVTLQPSSGYGFSHMAFGFGALLDAKVYLGEAFYINPGVSCTYSPFGILTNRYDTEFTFEVSAFAVEPKIGLGFSL